MDAIRTYTNTMYELEMAKTRLSLLLDRKEQLYAKYFPVTQKIKDDVIKGGKKDNDKMAMYVHELNEVDIGTGQSLAQEIEYQRDVVDRFKWYIEEMDEKLSKLTYIEHALYYEIVVNGVGISQAVRNIAERYNKEDYTIWKYHYSKIKKDIKKLKMFSDCIVNSVV